MAFSITYLANIKGVDFNRLMRPTHQADAKYSEEMTQNQESDLWDGMLPGSDVHFFVDVLGEWTFCKIPYSYSSLLDAPGRSETVHKVEEWEQVLRSLLPSNEIFRIDDFLVDGWNCSYDYLLFRSPEAVQSFLSWLRTQDKRHWSILPAG